MENTQLILDTHVIHTEYTGEVTHEQIMGAVRKQANLIDQHKNVCVLLFDYTNATMVRVRQEEVMETAQMSEDLTRARPYLEFIAVTPNSVDYGLARMWRTYSEFRGGVAAEQMHVCRDIGSAMQLADEIVQRKISNPLLHIS